MIALTHSTFRPVARPSFGGLAATVERWLARHAQRRALLTLDEARLKDIGVTAAEAWGEGSKPFWRG